MGEEPERACGKTCGICGKVRVFHSLHREFHSLVVRLCMHNFLYNAILGGDIIGLRHPCNQLQKQREIVEKVGNIPREVCPQWG